VKNFWTVFKKLFKKRIRPGYRILYAVTAGDYIGKFIVFVAEDDKKYDVMAIGGKESFELLSIPIKDVEMGLKSGVLDMVRKIPVELYNILQSEYNIRMRFPENKPNPYSEFYERYNDDEPTD